MSPATEQDGRGLPLLPIALIVAVLGVVGWFGWPYLRPAPAPEAGPTVSAVPAAPAPTPTPLPAGAPPAIAHPLAPPDAGAQATPLPALSDADPFVSERLAELIGRPQVLRFLQLDGFVRRAVATVDNLGRDHAPVMVWPVNPTPGRFSVATGAGSGAAQPIHPDNSARYEPFVQMVEAVDLARAVALYRALYPLFQQAYEELGFPGRYFNDRLVQVVDQLISTPVPETPRAVTLVQVKGEVPSTRPWVRYEFADPALEARPAGQKILLRMGADRQRRLQARLRELRAAIARP